MQSFLGVGAPEAILVAVVALVVFGPKGLADVSVLCAALHSTI
jgi:Sec-independent protein translocase protein TatA